MRDASESTQVIVTCHSPDLLDDSSIPEHQILAVTAETGATRIGPLDASARSALRDHLYAAGELLRLNQLRPDTTIPEPSAANDAQLFTSTERA